jgi:integrase
MKSKPKGSKYRNLTARGEVIYFESETKGERTRFSLGTSDWNEAAAARDLYRERKAKRRIGVGEPPRFADLAERYLQDATRHLAASTREDRTKLLAPGKCLATYFEAMRINEVTRATLLEWWQREVEGRDRSEKTGLQYLAALAGVFGLAVDLELLETNPVDALRGTLRRRRRTKRGRATAERAQHIQPIEAPEALQAFTAASRAAFDRRLANGRARRERQIGHVADLLQLDAGLRLGEAAGIRWRDVVWGDGQDDEARALTIREAIARGKHEGPPKSGRERTVALSRRLRSLLREFYIASGRPDASERILPHFRPRNYHARHFGHVCAAAGLRRHRPKDLRDTFASQLLTAGIQLGYISEQLGHSDVATTARHYARWAGGRAYRRPLEVRDGEVPADLIASVERLAAVQAPDRSAG